ncbi:MAG TPA: hypothetical protein VMF12_08750, partial [Xanthobacteraceae bacterium]|nr:hypothetical protein [Xanthobacteraceae bacterium]
VTNVLNNPIPTNTDTGNSAPDNKTTQNTPPPSTPDQIPANYCDYAPEALAALTHDASTGLQVGMYTTGDPAGPGNSIDAHGLAGASITRGGNLGVTDSAGLLAPGTTFGFRDISGGGGVVATYGVPGLPANQQLSLRGMFTYQNDDFTLTSFAGVSNAASARTNTYGFAGSAVYSVGQNYLIGSGGYKFGNGAESVSLNASAGSFDTRGYWADLKLGHVFVLADTISWGNSPGSGMATKALPTKAPPQSTGGYALGLDVGGHIGYSNGQVAGFIDSTGFVIGAATTKYGDTGAYAKLFAVIPNGQFVWKPYIAATVDQEFGFSSTASIPTQAALPSGDIVSVQQALTFGGAQVGVDARIPNGWVLGVSGFYQASADIDVAGGAASLRIPINYTPPLAFAAR